MEIIQNEDQLLRRVPFTDPAYIKDDGSLSSFAFKPKNGENGLSVNIAWMTTYEKSILDKARFRLYSISAGIPRSLELNCIYDPLPDNAAHALITGNFTKGICRQMASMAQRIAYPDK